MSLTNGNDLYLGLADTGFQKVLHSIYLARPHYFSYASAGMGGASIDVTPVTAMPVFGADGAGVNYSLQLTEPEIHFYPNPFQTAPPSPLPIAQNEFGIYVSGTLCILENGSPPTKVCATVEIWAIGRPIAIGSSGSSTISFSVDKVVVSGGGNFSQIVEYLSQKMLNAFFSKVQIPISSLTLAGLGLKLAQGPLITGAPPAQMQIWGHLSD